MPYDPYLIDRHVRFVEQDGDIARFISKSMTNPTSNEDKYHPWINIETGELGCECGDFKHRKAWLCPDVFSLASSLCKHLLRAHDNLARANQLPIKKCMNCLSPETRGLLLERVCNEQGDPRAGIYVCKKCIPILQESGHAASGNRVCPDCNRTLSRWMNGSYYCWYCKGFKGPVFSLSSS